ncbi:MAG TPA: Fe-S cluster assembly protein SufD [Ignavibacteria bacterium]|nr:Fe-S cluster assembly protein SufD [Ignavibacteria bacterium]
MENTRIKDFYISEFRKSEQSMNGEASSAFHQLRRQAIARFDEMGFPSVKNEDWKYTNIKQLFDFDFTSGTVSGVTKKDADALHIKGLNENIIVLVNGIYSEKLSFIKKQNSGIIIDNFNSALKNNPELVLEHTGKYASIENGFTALNTAFAKEGTVIFIPDNAEVKGHIHILNITGETGKHILTQPRNLVITGKNTKVNIIESYHSLGSEANLVNAVSEVVVGENSIVEIYRLQQENEGSFHINRTQAVQAKNSTFTHYSVTLGGGLVRNDTNVLLDAENCTGNLYGLYLTEGNQHVDNHTLIDHAKPHCQSNEMYKGVLNDNSRGVFNGKVFVREDAQKTNAYQSNKAILLAGTATIDTKPQLEIYADDVKCSHGAAIGQLDDEAVFYLRSRGIGADLAKRVLIRAFANDIFETIENETFHDHLNQLVFEKLG